MPTLVNLTFNIADLIGTDFDVRRTKVWIETNIPSGAVIDTTGKVVRLGDVKATVGVDGTGSFTGLFATNSADLNPTGFLYQAHVDYQTRADGRKRWASGWFALTATSDLASVTPVANAPVNTTEDAVIASRVGDPGSLTAAALSAAYVPMGSRDDVVATGNVSVGEVMGRIPFAQAHAAFPSVTKDANGDIVCVFRGGSAHVSNDGNAYLTRTTDGGRTWSTPVAFIDNADDVRDPCITTLANGDLAVTYKTQALAPGACKFIRSTDDGATWSAPVTIGFTWTGWDFVSAPVVELGDGTLVVAAYGKNTADARTSCRTMRSTDGGATWGNEVTLATGSLDYQEPNLLVTSTGTLRAFIRTEFTTPYVINTATSTDGGLTWSAVSLAFDGNGNPHAYRIPGTATVACVYRDQASGYATVRTSHDDGATWTQPYPFGRSDNYMTYGSMVETDGGQLLCVWGREDNSSSSHLHTVYLGAGSGVTPLGDLPSQSLYRVSTLVQSRKRTIPAATFSPSNGSPTVGVITSAVPGWFLDAAAVEGVASFLDFIPPWWKTYNIAILWAPTVAAAGNVQFDVSYTQYIAGNGLSGGTYVGGSANLAASNGATSVHYKQLVTGITNNLDRYPYVRILRNGPQAGDTYASDVALLAVVLEQAS